RAERESGPGLGRRGMREPQGESVATEELVHPLLHALRRSEGIHTRGETLQRNTRAPELAQRQACRPGELAALRVRGQLLQEGSGHGIEARALEQRVEALLALLEVRLEQALPPTVALELACEEPLQIVRILALLRRIEAPQVALRGRRGRCGLFLRLQAT